MTPIVQGARVYGFDQSRGDRAIRMISPFLKSPEHVASRIIKAVRDQPVYVHTAMGRDIDVMHRLSRRLHLAGTSMLYKQALRGAGRQLTGSCLALCIILHSVILQYV